MAKPIFVWNEHPLETPSGIFAMRLARYLRDRGFVVPKPVKVTEELKPITTIDSTLKWSPPNSQGLCTPLGLAHEEKLDIAKTTRSPTRKGIVKGIAERNPDNFVVTFHASEGNAQGDTRGLMKGRRIPSIYDVGDEWRNHRVVYISRPPLGVIPKVTEYYEIPHNLVCIEVGAPASYERWKKRPFLGWPPEKLTNTRGVFVPKKDDVIYTDRFISAMGDALVKLAAERGYTLRKRPKQQRMSSRRVARKK